MGIYIYSLRKKPRTVNVDGEFREVKTFDYAYKVSYSGRHSDSEYGRSYRLLVSNTERRAEEAWYAVGRKPTLAVWEDELWLITKPLWQDTGEAPGIRVGKLRKVGRRWYCDSPVPLASLSEAIST